MVRGYRKAGKIILLAELGFRKKPIPCVLLMARGKDIISSYLDLLYGEFTASHEFII